MVSSRETDQEAVWLTVTADGYDRDGVVQEIDDEITHRVGKMYVTILPSDENNFNVFVCPSETNAVDLHDVVSYVSVMDGIRLIESRIGKICRPAGESV